MSIQPFDPSLVALFSADLQECFGIMARIVTEDLVVVQNLIHLHLLESSMNSNHIAAEITDPIEKKNKLPRVCMCCVRERCSKPFSFRVRPCAITCHYLDWSCFPVLASHVMYHVGAWKMEVIHESVSAARLGTLKSLTFFRNAIACLRPLHVCTG